MTKFYLRVIISFALILPGCAKKPLINTELSADKAYSTVQGSNLNFAHLKHRWIIINYWATWCPPCIKEMPELSLAATSLDATVVGINLESMSDQELNKFLVENKIFYPVIRQDIVKNLYNVSIEVYPTTYLLNANGKLVHTFEGPVTLAQLQAKIAEEKP